MEIVSFSVKNYRSITKTEKINLSKLTILVGPNNEGKSNILKAFVLGTRLLSKSEINTRVIRSKRGGMHSTSGIVDDYVWTRDFPLKFQSKVPEGKTELIFEFHLTEKENEDFKKEVKSYLNGSLPIKITINKQGTFEFKVNKTGKGSKSLSSKRELIAKFIFNRIESHYIPAIRSSEEALSIITAMIRMNLYELRKNENYLKYLEEIRKLERPVFENISRDIKLSLSNFLPTIKNVIIDIESARKIENPLYYSDISLKIDDGTLTDIKYKGDGVQSLAAISLIKKSLELDNLKDIILTIEEPEAHLHPKAIHQLKKILVDISKKQQVIITTHSPLLIDLEKVEHNIIVTNNKAKTAQDIKEIREILGVKTPDNLSSAEMVLFVEGKTDVKVITKILEYKSNYLKNALENKRLIIMNLRGVSKIEYILSLYKNLHLTKVFFFCDNDNSATTAIKNLKAENLIEENEYKLAIQIGMKESELEDLFDFSFYKNKFMEEFGVNLDNKEFKKTNKKWSERVKKCFENNGAIYEEEKVKTFFADIILETFNENTCRKNEELFNSLVSVLELRLKKENE